MCVLSCRFRVPSTNSRIKEFNCRAAAPDERDIWTGWSFLSRFFIVRDILLEKFGEYLSAVPNLDAATIAPFVHLVADGWPCCPPVVAGIFLYHYLLVWIEWETGTDIKTKLILQSHGHNDILSPKMNQLHEFFSNHGFSLPLYYPWSIMKQVEFSCL